MTMAIVVEILNKRLLNCNMPESSPEMPCCNGINRGEGGIVNALNSPQVFKKSIPLLAIEVHTIRKYIKKYFINFKPFLIKTFNIRICFYKLTS